MKSRLKSGLFFGTVGFEGVGGFPEKMVSALLENGVVMRNVRLLASQISGECSPFAYYLVAKTARKNGVRLRVKKRRGLYFQLSRYKTRSGLYAGFLVFVMMISLMKTRVLDIDVTGDAPREQTLKILAECGIEEGKALSELNFSQAEQRLMLDIENCAWVDVSREGFRVKAEVRKGDEAPEVEGKNPRNITASRPARIVSMTVRKGKAAVSVGSGVNMGDMLVSGTVFDGRNKIMFVHSDAEIIGEFLETQEFFVPYSETVNLPKGEVKRFDSIVFGDDEYPLYFGEAFAENSVYSEETRLIFGDKSPVKIKSRIYTAYVATEITRSPDDVVKELRRQKGDFEGNFYSEYKIVTCTEKFFPEKGGIRLIVDYTLQGDIAKAVDIGVVEMSE